MDNSLSSSKECLSSEPISTSTAPINKFVAFEGSTCSVERFYEDGQTLCRKSLKGEFAGKELFLNALRKEYEVGRTLDCIYLPRYIRLENNNEGVPSAIVMENIEGSTLEDILNSHPDYFNSADRLKKLLFQLCDGLEYLHQRQIVHFDIQPRNIMLTRVGADVRIIDLGYCYTDNFQDTLGGTPNFSSYDRMPDTRSDIFSIGKLIHYINSHSSKPLSTTVMKVAQKCIEPDSKYRYESIEQLKQVLEVAFTNKKKSIPYFIPLIILGGIICSFFIHNRFFYNSFSALSNADSTVFYFNILDKDSSWVSLSRPDNSEVKYAGSVTIPDTVEHYGQKYAVVEMADSCLAFHDSITIITLPPTLRKIDEGAAYMCKQLAILNLPDDITSIGKAAFFQCINLKHLRLPVNLRELGEASFAFCKNITELNIPNGVTELPQDAFACCDKLSEVTLPDNLKYLRRGVFWRCKALKSITIPASVTQMDELIFYDCKSLREVIMKPLTPPRAITLFNNENDITIYVPEEAVDAYRNAPYWKKLKIESVASR